MDQKTTTYAPRTRHWHKLLLCVGLVAALGVEECEFDLGFVSIDSPQAKTFTEAQTVTITATARSGEGLTVVGVDFYRNGRKMGTTDFTPPYTHNWPITAADSDQGPHRWHAEAAYQVGSKGEERLKSDEVVYEVNIAPVPGGRERILGSISGFVPQVTLGDLVFDATSGIVIGLAQGQLIIADLSDPTRPSLSTRLDLDFSETGVAVSGRLVFVVGSVESSGTPLVVLDVSDPRRPVTISRSTLPGSGAAGVGVAGSVAYVGNASGLHVLDVSDPQAPRVTRSVPTPQPISGVRLGAGLILVGSSSGFGWFDARDPRNPEFLGFTGFRGSYEIVEDVVYVAGSTALTVLDFSDPRRPSRIEQFVQPGMLSAAAAANRLYVPSISGLEAFDVSDPKRPRSVGEVPLPAIGRSLASSGNLVVATDRNGDLHVLSVQP